MTVQTPAFSLIMGCRSWAGSAIGGIRETQEISADRIEACDRVVGSDVRYRFVIDVATTA